MANKTLTSLIGGTALLASALNADADVLLLDSFSSGITTPNPKIEHKVGGVEGANGEDAYYPGFGGQVIDFYSQVGSNNLITDVRPYNSLGTPSLKILGSGLSGQVSVTVKPIILTDNGAFTNKNIYSDLYSVTNGVRANLIRTDNLKQMASTNGAITGLTITNGHCYDLDVRFVPNPVPAPTLTSLVANEDGTVNLGITNTYEGVKYGIENSSDMQNWQNVTNNLNLSYPSAVVSNVPLPQIIVGTNSTNQSATFGNSPVGFYRVKVE